MLPSYDFEEKASLKRRHVVFILLANALISAVISLALFQVMDRLEQRAESGTRIQAAIVSPLSGSPSPTTTDEQGGAREPIIHQVRPGDTLESIAKRFDTTIALLKEMNEETIKGDSIRPNDHLKVCTETFSVLIDKSANALTLKAGERIVKVYSVGTGREGITPVGAFTIVNKIVEPEWFKPGEGVIPYGDPRNLLGTRWMGLSAPLVGIHGTPDAASIGYSASHGCVRMLIPSVEWLFERVTVGTPVFIVPA